MNTERPDHDDAAAGTAEEAPEQAETPKRKASEDGGGAAKASEDGADSSRTNESSGSTESSESSEEQELSETTKAAEEQKTPEVTGPPEKQEIPEKQEPSETAEAAEEQEPSGTTEASEGQKPPEATEVAEATKEQETPETTKAAEEQEPPEATRTSEEQKTSEATETPEEQKAPEAAKAPEEQKAPEAAQDTKTPEEQKTPEGQEAPDVTAAPGGEDGPSGGWRVRGRSPVVIASVAATVLLVGGGGAFLAAGTSEPVGTAASDGRGTPPPLALDGYFAPGAASAADRTDEAGRTHEIAPGEPNPYGAAYRADGTLPGGPGSAPVYRARGEVTREEVARLAEALGVEGTPVADAQAWRVGSEKDGSGPLLRVSKQAPGMWTFSRYAPGTDNCKGALCTPVTGDPSVRPVSAAAAREAAAPVLKALGQDDAKVDASQVLGAQRVVNADPRVDGLPTYGWTTGLSIDEQGEVISGSGRLKAPVKDDTYPVLSARETLGLMNATPRTDPRAGTGGCASPVPLKDRPEAPCVAAASAPPHKESLTRNAFTVDKAVFGLASHTSDGRRALVPSWLFQVRAPGGQGDPFTVTYPAVDPKYLTAPKAPGGSDGTSSDGTSVKRDVKVTGYRAEGEELTVRFEGGVCADYRASVKEESGRVTVTVTETSRRDQVCILIAKVHHESVRLDRPLGDRKVVGSDGREIPRERPGARLPESSPAR